MMGSSSSANSFAFSTNPASSFMMMPNTSFTDLLNYGGDEAIIIGDGQISGLAERNAERTGSSVPKFKSIPPPMLPISPPSASYFAMPPGLSPSELLDSPVLLSSSSNLLPSPTTGTFPAQAFHLKFNPSNAPQEDAGLRQEEKSSFNDFTFQTQKRPNDSSSTIFFQSPFPPNSTEQALRGYQPLHQQQQQQSWNFQCQQEEKVDKQPLPGKSMPVQGSGTPSNQKHHMGRNDENDHHHTSQYVRDQRGSDDGYNWRKYGQKQVKGSENPRSYYKCSFPNCPTRKNVERSLDGQITEIVYRGNHNHAKPLNPRRSSAGSAASSTPGIQSYSRPNHVNKVEDLSSSAGQMESVETLDNSSISIVDDELDVSSDQRIRSARGNLSDIERDAKRWKGEGEIECISGAPGSRTVREPRVVVQTPSNIEVLDDGYRWRKYGQKVVRGNTNPRNYYKCTHAECPVRKHVERAAHDAGSVITTYEGRHNHDVPPPRGRQAAQITNSGAPRAMATRPSVNYSNISSNHPVHNLSSSLSPSLEGQSPFALEMLQSPGSFGFSGFYGSVGSLLNQEHNITDMFLNRAKEEFKEDSFCESLLC